ncbi:hypothetical protein Trydic_g10987 [Trypoxylus dichotomus]
MRAVCRHSKSFKAVLLNNGNQPSIAIGNADYMEETYDNLSSYWGGLTSVSSLKNFFKVKKNIFGVRSAKWHKLPGK